MSGPLDRLIARIAGDAADLHSATSVAEPLGEAETWFGEVVDEEVVSSEETGPPVHPPRIASLHAEPSAPSPRASASTAPQPRSSLRQTDVTAVPDAPVSALGIPEPPPRAAVMAANRLEAAPSYLRAAPPAPERADREAPPAPQSVAAEAPPNTASSHAASDQMEDTPSDTVVIEIGRIEVNPPQPARETTAPLRPQPAVSLASYLADRRAGRR